MRSVKFDIRVSPEERKMIDLLAAQEQRSASDTIRQLIRRAVLEGSHAPRQSQPDDALVLLRP